MLYRNCLIPFLLSFLLPLSLHIQGIASLDTPPKSFKCRDTHSSPSHISFSSCYYDTTCKRCPLLPGNSFLFSSSKCVKKNIFVKISSQFGKFVYFNIFHSILLVQQISLSLIITLSYIGSFV